VYWSWPLFPLFVKRREAVRMPYIGRVLDMEIVVTPRIMQRVRERHWAGRDAYTGPGVSAQDRNVTWRAE
jgi:hypothetical protein